MAVAKLFVVAFVQFSYTAVAYDLVRNVNMCVRMCLPHQFSLSFNHGTAMPFQFFSFSSLYFTQLIVGFVYRSDQTSLVSS